MLHADDSHNSDMYRKWSKNIQHPAYPYMISMEWWIHCFNAIEAWYDEQFKCDLFWNIMGGSWVLRIVSTHRAIAHCKIVTMYSEFSQSNCQHVSTTLTARAEICFPTCSFGESFQAPRLHTTIPPQHKGLTWHVLPCGPEQSGTFGQAAPWVCSYPLLAVLSLAGRGRTMLLAAPENVRGPRGKHRYMGGINRLPWNNWLAEFRISQWQCICQDFTASTKFKINIDFKNNQVPVIAMDYR